MQVTRRGFLAMGAMFALAGCSGGNDAPKAEDAQAAESTAEEAPEVAEEAIDFDGTGYEDTGDLAFYLTSAGGSTEDGNIPQILIDPNTYGYGVDVNVFDGDGTICAVYIDGHERMKLNAGDTQQNLLFEDSDMTEGIHKVELVSASDEGASIYKSAEYEIVLS